MQEFPINWFAILAAVIIKQAIGAFWYSPALFGPSWCKLAGVSEAEMKAGGWPRLLFPTSSARR
jgi:hypothetical protein